MLTNAEKLAQVKSTWKIILGVAGALGGVLLILVLLGILIKYAFVRPSIAGGLSDPDRYALLAKARAEDHRLTSTYGWMDKSKGVVRLPVEVAMRELIEERKQ